MTAGVPLPDAPLALAGRRVFTANGVDFTVADLARRASAGDREPTLSASSDFAEESFRRSRGLLRADQLESWLATWQIDADDFRRWTEDSASGTSTATRWCSMVCSGGFDATVAEIAGAVAAACELGEGPAAAADFDSDGWTDRLVAGSTTTEALTTVIEANRLDWTRLVTVGVNSPRRGVAEELRHQILTDGVDLKLAAERAGCTATEFTDVLAAFMPTRARGAVAGARAGEVVGPVPTDDGWLVLMVLDRTDPTLDDEQTRVRAQAVLRTDVITRAVARHVVA
jgi:hypothetical protein